MESSRQSSPPVARFQTSSTPASDIRSPDGQIRRRGYRCQPGAQNPPGDLQRLMLRGNNPAAVSDLPSIPVGYISHDTGPSSLQHGAPSSSLQNGAPFTSLPFGVNDSGLPGSLQNAVGSQSSVGTSSLQNGASASSLQQNGASASSLQNNTNAMGAQNGAESNGSPNEGALSELTLKAIADITNLPENTLHQIARIIQQQLNGRPGNRGEVLDMAEDISSGKLSLASLLPPLWPEEMSDASSDHMSLGPSEHSFDSALESSELSMSGAESEGEGAAVPQQADAHQANGVARTQPLNGVPRTQSSDGDERSHQSNVAVRSAQGEDQVDDARGSLHPHLPRPTPGPSGGKPNLLSVQQEANRHDSSHDSGIHKSLPSAIHKSLPSATQEEEVQADAEMEEPDGLLTQTSEPRGAESAENPRNGAIAISGPKWDRLPEEVKQRRLVALKLLGLQTEFEILEAYRKCNKCKVRVRDTTFLPCGHFMMCKDCSEPVFTCPNANCGVAIEATATTFLS